MVSALSLTRPADARIFLGFLVHRVAASEEDEDVVAERDLASAAQQLKVAGSAGDEE